MVKNITGGNKAKKGKRGGRMSKNPTSEFNTDDGLHFYGQMIGKIGGNTIEVLLQTGETVHASIPGRFHKRVWFNKDDLIVVRQESGKFYDVIQKITNPSTMLAASTVLNIKIDKDNSNIFRTDIVEEESDDDETTKTTDSKTNLMLERRKKDKERDIQRRGEENDDFDRVISVVTKEDLESDKSGSVKSDDSVDSVDSLGNHIEKKSAKTVTDIVVETDSTDSTDSTNSTNSSDSSDSSDSSESEEDFTPIPVLNKKKITTQTNIPNIQNTPKTPPGKTTKVIEPNAPERPNKPIKPTQKKNIVYEETAEDIKRMLNLD
jgi:translation initiation factor IF-1